jgi:hypothetical protein
VSTATSTRAEIEFDRVYPWAVKSRRQLELLNAWQQLRPQRDALPSLTELDSAQRRYPDQDELTIFDVVRENAGLRYLIVKEGLAFKRSLGQTGTGRFLDEILPQIAWDTAQPNYDACVQQRLPVYAAFSVFEHDEENVVYERLLLPFGSDGNGVDRRVDARRYAQRAPGEIQFSRRNRPGLIGLPEIDIDLLAHFAAGADFTGSDSVLIQFRMSMLFACKRSANSWPTNPAQRRSNMR